MRCLHCNKKLSLLKLAKGDSFCSPEHFDAYQFQLSKTAIDRLMNTPVEEGPKLPLIIRKQEDVLPEAPLPAADAPPYAPFAASLLSSCAPDLSAPAASDLDRGQQAASTLEVSLPVREVATTGLLNLYARLSFAEAPLNWTSPRNFILAENFPAEVIRPSVVPSPDFSQLENPVSSESVRAIESRARVGALTPRPRLPFLIAPSFRERTAPLADLDTADRAIPVRPALIPILGAGPRHSDLARAIGRLTGFAERASLQTQDSTTNFFQGTPELPAPVLIALPRSEQKTHPSGWHVSSCLIGLTNRILDTDGPVICVPPVPESMVAGPVPGFAPHSDAARLLEGQPSVRRIILPVSQELVSTSKPPRPEPPGRMSPIGLTAQESPDRTIKTTALFSAPVEKPPFGEEAALPDPSVSAIKLGWRSALAKFPLVESFSTATWQNQASHYALAASIADGPELPAIPIQLLPYVPACIQKKPPVAQTPSLANQPYRWMTWRETGYTVSGWESPAPSATLPKLCFSAVPNTSARAELLRSSTLPVMPERAFAAAPSTVFPKPELLSATLTSFPQATQNVAGRGTVSLCTSHISCGPRPSGHQNRHAVKFLPIREGPTLPSARNWVRLRSLHR